MAIEAEGEQAGDPVSSKAVPSPKDSDRDGSQGSYCPPDQKETTPAKKALILRREFILSVARKYSAKPVQNSDPRVWGVLTAISQNARKRPQGINILLTEDEHWFGRSAEDARLRIDSISVSGRHCRIYRKKFTTEDVEHGPNFHNSVYLHDTSTNGTYINWEKIKKGSPEAKLQHGDIVSLAAAPHHEIAFAFVYREVPNSVPALDGATLKRKADEFVLENKRLKGIGIGAPEGPISLDDVRSLQRSNTDLRKQLESHVLTIEKVLDEKNSAIARHESEMKELKETVSKTYREEINDLRCMLDLKQKELVKVNAISAGRQQAIEDLNERLAASLQSRIDADEIINNQKGTMSELERQLDEERNLRKEEREKALADQKAILKRAQLEAQEELKRQTEVASRQERELKEVITKLQESDKESRLLVEALRSKLEDTRESLVTSEKKVRQLESQILEEQKLSSKERKKSEALEQEMKRLKKELEDEKVAREEAWAKVSALELEMAAAIRDLSIEKQRFQGARERIILRETQLRAFYSTTEEISALFAKQQEQLKAMQRTLEDEENYENLSVDIDLCTTKANTKEATVGENTKHHRGNGVTKESSAASTPRVERIHVESSSDEASVTEKHEYDFKSQEGHDTQDQECSSGEQAINGGFGSDINGIDTAPILDGELVETEKVIGTESPAVNVGMGNIDLDKPDALAGDTMQLDNDTYVQEDGGDQRAYEDSARFSQSNRPLPLEGSLKAMEEDTEGAVETIRTADLLTSEVAGSWAISTAPSVHGESDSPRSGEGDGNRNDDDDGVTRALACSSDFPAAASQTIPAGTATMNWSQERQALHAMIEIVAPEFKESFCDNDGSVRGRSKAETSASDSGTEGDDDVNEIGVEGGSISEADTQEGSDVPNEDDNQVGDGMDGCDDATQEDSLG